MSAAEYDPSPVPADADLWPGELPFTAWGQHPCGSLDLRVFDQDIYWVDIEQQAQLIQGMSRDYVANVIRFLAESGEYFYLGAVRREILQGYGDVLLGRVPTSVVAEAAGVPTLQTLTPAAWLEGTPLMRRLRRTLAAHDDA